MGLGIKIPKSALTAGREKFAHGDENSELDLEPGKYMFQIVKGRGVDTKKGPQIVFDLSLVGEDKKGKVGVFYGLEEERIVYLFRLFAMLGYDVADLTEEMLEEIIADIEKNKPVVRVKVSKKDEYTNYRIEKLIEDVSFLGGEAPVVVPVVAPVVVVQKAAPVAPKPAPTPTVAPVAATKTVTPKAAPAPTPSSEEVADDEAVPDEEVTLKIGMRCKANLKIGEVDVEIKEIHESENKVTARCKTEGENFDKLFKFGVEKLM